MKNKTKHPRFRDTETGLINLHSLEGNEGRRVDRYIRTLIYKSPPLVRAGKFDFGKDNIHATRVIYRAGLHTRVYKELLCFFNDWSTYAPKDFCESQELFIKYVAEYLSMSIEEVGEIFYNGFHSVDQHYLCIETAPGQPLCEKLFPKCFGQYPTPQGLGRRLCPPVEDYRALAFSRRWRGSRVVDRFGYARPNRD